MARRLIVEIVGDAGSLERSLARAGAVSQSFGSRMESVGKKMTTSLTLPIVGAAAVSTDLAVKFQNSMEQIHTQAGVSQQAVEGFSKALVAMSGSVATGPEELSKGLFHLASQGLRGAKALDALRIAAEGAKVGGADLEDVTNALGAVISGKLVTGAGGFQKAMGELNATVGAGDMHMQDLADAMGTGLPAKAAVAGVSLRDVGAALAVFGDNNIRGAAAGTLLNSTLRLMEGPSKAAAKAMAAVGINAADLGDALRNKGLVAAVELLKEKLSGLSKTGQFQALTRMFGGRQAGGVMILIDQLERLKTKVREVDAGGNKFASDWEAYTKTTSYHLASMGAQMQASGITIGDVLLPVVTKVADALGKLADKFDSLSPGVQKAIIVAAGLAAALGPVLFVIGNVITVVKGLGVALDFLAANPVVLIIAGLVALGVALYEAWEHSATFRRIVTDAFHEVENIAQDFADFFTRTIPAAFERVVGWLKSNWEPIAGALIAGPIGLAVGLVVQHFGQIKAAVERGLHEIVAFIKGLAGEFLSAGLDLAKALGDGILHGIEHAAGGVVGAAKGLADKVKGFLSFHWGSTPHDWAAANVGKPIADGIVAGFLLGGQNLPSSVSSKVRAALEAAKQVIDQYRSVLQTAWGQLTSDVDNAFDAVTQNMQTKAGKALALMQAQDAANQLQQQLDQAQQAVQQANAQLSTDQAAAGGTGLVDAQNAYNQATAQLAAAVKSKADSSTIEQLRQGAAAAKKSLDDILKVSPAQLQQDQQALVQAQQQLVAAQRAIKEAALQKQAAEEQKQLDARRALEKRHMDAALAALEQELARQGATHKRAQDAILKLLGSYGISYKNSGIALGTAFAKGLEESVAKVEEAARKLAEAASKYLPHSPAEKGPLSKPIGWGNYLMAGLPEATSAISGALAGGLSAPGVGRGVGGGGAAGGSLTVNVYGFVGNKQELIGTLSSAFMQAGRQGHPLWAPLLRTATA